MKVRVTGDPAAFKALAFPYLQRDPVLNSVLISNIQGRVDSLLYDPAPPVFVSVHRDGEVVGVACCTALRGVMLGELDEEFLPLVLAAVVESGAAVKFVEGVPEVTLAFAEQYADQLGRQLVEDRLTRLHRLVDFSPLEAEGHARLATEADLAATVRMIGGFGDAIGGRITVEEEERWACDRIRLRRLWVWEYDGRVVSMAGHNGDVFGAARIGSVYTPPEDRGNGYAGALTAALTRHLLDEGTQPCLFTDLANPTSNKLYARIGYRKVVDFVRYAVS
ncbi:GNAT family N-acetyltransferase [Kribbella italica]|uniref:RimJ/RimL family protein N-acetyltransferase n=1 Tax=Kribbella italica TaxID=1540520 RepID=A0A7W9MWK1_9ACTN|nr:GNAT family N-acetyltransferase [Kribbella italica]MBB5838382.1 RimJ/RimL family protein N-acetyltransferase [Kribbella italica]